MCLSWCPRPTAHPHFPGTTKAVSGESRVDTDLLRDAQAYDISPGLSFKCTFLLPVRKSTPSSFLVHLPKAHESRHGVISLEPFQPRTNQQLLEVVERTGKGVITTDKFALSNSRIKFNKQKSKCSISQKSCQLNFFNNYAFC